MTNKYLKLDNRKLEYDYLKGILIIFVVWGHLCAYTSGEGYEKNLLTSYIRLFQMPLFIFISGYFQKSLSNISDLRSKIGKTIRHIVVPFLSWTIFSFLFMLGFDLLNNVSLNFMILLDHFLSTLSMYWFLGCLILCQVYYYFIDVLCILCKNRLFLLLFSVFPIILIRIPCSFYFQFLWLFYLLGILFHGKDLLLVSQNINKIIFIALIIIALFLGYYFKTNWTFYNISNYIFGSDYGKYSKIYFIFGRYLVYCLVSFVALVFFLRIYNFIKNKKITKSLCKIGQETLVIYVSHIFFLLLFFSKFVNAFFNGCILPCSDFLRFYLLCPILTSLFVFITYKLSRILKCNHIISGLFCG